MTPEQAIKAHTEALNGKHYANHEDPAPSSGKRCVWSSRLVTVDATWLTEPPPPQKFLMRDVRTGRGAIPAHGVAIVGAAGGTGKSYSVVEAAIAQATGTQWLGTFESETPGRSLILTAEDPKDDMRRRTYHSGRAMRVSSVPADAIGIIDVHDIHVPLLTKDAQPTEYAEALVAFVKASGPYSLVVVDPLARLAGANIDADNTAACALVTVLESVASAAGGLVLGLHHTSQGARRGGILDATALRGATGLGDSARLVMLLTAEEMKLEDAELAAKLGEIVTLTRAKANHVGRWEPVRLRRNEHGVLLPLDRHDEDLLRSVSPSIRKATAKEAERRQRHEQIDAALRTLLEERAGIGTAELRAAMKNRLGSCSVDTFNEAIERVGVRRVHGKGKNVHHHLPERGVQ